ncbi:Leucine rich repeat protein [Novymonas esmeraldas]|uniref:Leucine rich repeat protein n=1 Tax=Novymonas esmeraldas TaxID=1808958 RepID=A0AAW0F111_9TRYP
MSTRRPHLHSAGATRMRAAVVLPVLLLLLACAAAGPLCVRAVDTSSYEEAERTNTLAFLQSFVTPGSTLADVWTGTDFCKWTYITCEVSSVTLDLRELRPTAPLALPELADGVDGGSVLLTRIRADGLGSSLSGTLPASWGRLTRLRFVQLAGNALTGSLPADWCSLTGLLVLSVSDNAFTGTLPAEWGSLRRLSALDVSVNQLTGPIPEPWSSMSSLSSLYLESNQLTGAIPTALGDMWPIRVDISSNQFCGCVSSLWNSSSVTLTADPSMRAVNCMSANACAVDESSSPAERATLAFLQGFAVSLPSLQSVWADTRYCAWPGVACTMDKDVTLDFADVALTAVGSLPALSDSVNGSLIPLTQVRISGKGAMVSGQLPASWSRLTGLREVTLAGNALTGPLPAEWGSMWQLRKLSLGNNKLTGPLPVEWSSLTQLQTLTLGSNGLTGPLPAVWSSLKKLQTLTLGSNGLTGPLPAVWSSLTQLQALSLRNNGLSGSLPAEWGGLTQLQALRLGNNGLSGSLPAEWSSLKKLQTLTLRSNGLSGSLPFEWSCLTQLQALSLANNGLSGSLPVEWSSLKEVEMLVLSDNTLNGSLPAEWGSMWQLLALDLESNGLTGPLPAQWGSLTALDSLALHANQLSGSLPATWSNMRRIQSLNLGENELTGAIPESWWRMSSLSYLALNSNQLTGAIPTAVGDMWPITVDISSNQFCGCVSSRWNSSFSVTLTADPSMRAVNCMSANACAVDESSSPAERATLAFLQGFAVSLPSLQSVWADTRYCAWPGVACTMDKDVTLDFADVALTAVGSLPALSDSVNESLIPLTQVRISGKGAMVSGQLPASWGRLTQLREVTLAGNALTGPLPAEWGSMWQLRKLSLGNNELTGPLPAEWGTFRWLRELNVSRNALTGPLPAEWGSLWLLGLLDLSRNALTGPLPEEWSKMHLLEELYLNNNELTGTIPSRMGLLSLSTVDISRNQFAGCAPRQWGESCSLTLRADPPMTTGVCAIDKSCDGKSGSAASSNSGECEVTGCARCEVGAARVCARCEPGYILTGAKSCAKEGSGVAADARAGAVVAAVTCAVLAFSLVMTL